jgi:hypothetical protein
LHKFEKKCVNQGFKDTVKCIGGYLEMEKEKGHDLERKMPGQHSSSLRPHSSQRFGNSKILREKQRKAV